MYKFIKKTRIHMQKVFTEVYGLERLLTLYDELGSLVNMQRHFEETHNEHFSKGSIKKYIEKANAKKKIIKS